MRKILLVMLAFLFVNVHAEDELVRKSLSDINIQKKFSPIPLQFYDQKVEFAICLLNDNETVAIKIPARKSTNKQEYFKSLTITIRWFLKNWKVGKLKYKNIAFALEGDMENYPYLFKFNTNNLRLLDNRDFGAKDMTAFDDDGGFVYPLKLILRRGEFISKGNKLLKLKQEYSKFLETFDISPLIEGTIEAWYEKKKTKK